MQHSGGRDFPGDETAELQDQETPHDFILM
jgi:hypothetical protein